MCKLFANSCEQEATEEHILSVTSNQPHLPHCVISSMAGFCLGPTSLQLSPLISSEAGIPLT